MPIGRGVELERRNGGIPKDSPSKTTKIVMRYINSLPDVGPPIKKQPVTFACLKEMSKDLILGD
jgi:hypothetical protein